MTEPDLTAIVLPDQPDRIDEDSRDLPNPRRAARRVSAFLAAWGDGLIHTADPGDGHPRPLYARDLEAICRATQAAGRQLWMPLKLDADSNDAIARLEGQRDDAREQRRQANDRLAATHQALAALDIDPDVAAAASLESTVDEVCRSHQVLVDAEARAASEIYDLNARLAGAEAERDDANTALNQITAHRDALHRQRDAARADRAEARKQRDQARADLDQAHATIRALTAPAPAAPAPEPEPDLEWIAQAISDPGSIVDRWNGPPWGYEQTGHAVEGAPEQEPTTRWAARAVLAVLAQARRRDALRDEGKLAAARADRNNYRRRLQATSEAANAHANTVYHLRARIEEIRRLLARVHDSGHVAALNAIRDVVQADSSDADGALVCVCGTVVVSAAAMRSWKSARLGVHRCDEPETTEGKQN